MVITFKKNSEITSVAELAERANTVGKGVERLLFRGQNTDKPLKPKIARHQDFTVDIEKKMFGRFKRESAPFLFGPAPQSDWDWLSIAQHQGMSTRLLDWSANALAALWFAVAQDPPDQEPHGVVWMLNIRQQDLKSPGAADDIWGLRRTYVFQPFHIDRRIAAQSGWFSVHKFVDDKKQFISLDANLAFKAHLNKFKVPRECFVTIRQELRRMGVTRATLFPDLGGLCADIDGEFLCTQTNPAEI
jgi:hypothetical protein